MGIASFATQTVTVQRATKTTDSYGRVVYDWSEPAEHTLSHCSVQPREGSEMFDAAGQRVISRWQLRAAEGDMLEDDRIVHDGEVYAIDGEVGHWSSPTGALTHMTATLKRGG